MMLLTAVILLAIAIGTTASMLVIVRDDMEPKFFRVNAIISSVIFALAYLFMHEKPALILSALTLVYAATVLWLPSGFERLILCVVLIYGAISIHHHLLPATLHWNVVSILLCGLLMGFSLVAMNVGHWYLSATKLSIRPLKAVTLSILILLFIRLCWLLSLFVFSWSSIQQLFQMEHLIWMVFAMVRILFGVLGPLALGYMTWETIKLNATQSATGILYALLALVLVGEASSIFLTLETTLPF